MGEIDQSVKYLLQIDAQNMLAFTVPGLQVAEPLPSEIAASPQLVLGTLFRGTYQQAPCLSIWRSSCTVTSICRAAHMNTAHG